jgi:hypothetical protein
MTNSLVATTGLFTVADQRTSPIKHWAVLSRSWRSGRVVTKFAV